MSKPKNKYEERIAFVNGTLKEDVSEIALKRAVDAIGPVWEDATFFYFTVLEEACGLPVKRLYRLYRMKQKNNPKQPLRYFTFEVARVIEGVLFCKQRLGLGCYYYDTFSYSSEITLKHDRRNGSGYCLMDLFGLSEFCTDEFFGNRVLCIKTNPDDYKRALKVPYMETLCNSNDFMFQKLSVMGHIDRISNSLRIARKRGLDLTEENAYLWIDMWQMLDALGKDVNNPFYVAPKDLKHAHDVISNYIQKKREKEERERRMGQMIEAIKKAEAMKEEYRVKHERYNHVAITDGEIVIKVLPTIDSFLVEGMKQHHCVCANQYFDESKHPNTLILSARIGDWDNPTRYVETIDVDTKEWVLRDARGLQNQVSEYHDRIVDLMEENMWMLMKAAETGELRMVV